MNLSLALRVILFTLVAPFVVSIVVRGILLDGARPVAAQGLVVSVVGAAIYAWTAWNFAQTGRGTPAPLDPPKTVVAVGLYRWVRNPMYIGVLLIILGQAIAYGSLILVVYAVVMWLVVHAFVVLYEEPDLIRRFGDPYESYRRAVPRWVPRPPRSAEPG